MLCGASCFAEPMFVMSGFSAFTALPTKGSKKPSLPFERDTAGLTPGEGGAMFVLKRLADAERDGDRIYGTMLGAYIDNAGRGQPLKPIMESERDCLKGTYKKFGVPPESIQYLECHATGTAQGDTCELNAIREVFGDRMPLIGSCKGNFGHTLVAAGFAGCAKLLLSMNHGQIPPTPKDKTVIDRHVVTKNTPWPPVPAGCPKRAGLSAFGFGGTDAHAVFEEYRRSPSPLAAVVPSAPTPISVAIVGMAARFGALKDLRELERAIYSGGDGACELPPKRWRFLANDGHFRAALEAGETVRGCFIDKVDVDYGRLKLTLLPEDELQAQQLLALSTIDRALTDSGITFEKGAKVAVFVGLGTDMELYRHRARVALRERLGLSPDATLTPEQAALLSYVGDVSTATSYTSNIGNIIATRTAALWNFTGPAFTVTQGANSVFRCLELANMMLATGEIEGAVVAGVDMGGSAEALFTHRLHAMFSNPEEQLGSEPSAAYQNAPASYFVGEGCGALVLKRLGDCGREGSPKERVYACIEAITEAGTVRASAQAALDTAGVDGSEVGYVELSADGAGALCDEEVDGAAAIYRSDGGARSAAVGTVKTTVGHTGYASGAAALIKAALCLHHRYLPQTAKWKGPLAHKAADWATSSLYVPSSSRAWVANESGGRFAAVSGVAGTAPDSKFSVLLSDAAHCYEENNVISLDADAPKLVTLGGESIDAVQAAVRASLGRLEGDDAATEDELAKLLLATVASEKAREQRPFTLCLITTAAGLKRELERASKGVQQASASGKEWSSPAGSYFTPRPRHSPNVAFMYGDGSSPYAALGEDMHRIAPRLHEFVQRATTAMWSKKLDTWNPRTVEPAAAEEEGAQFEKRTVDMFRAGVYHAVCFTHVARNLLKIAPKTAFGLSLGEASMLFSFDEANCLQSDALLDGLASSPVWTSQLSGKFNALRSAWNIPSDTPVSDFWVGYVVQASRAAVEKALDELGAATDCVRLVIVNDSKTCIIGGKPQQCKALISRLGCGGFPLEQGMAGHCKEVAPFHDAISSIHSPLRAPVGAAAAGVEFLSSAYGSVGPLAQKGAPSMGDLVASIYGGVADFPALVSAASRAGSDIFIELGAGDFRAAATREVLSAQGAAHVAVAIDRRGADSWKQMLKMCATLISHGVESGCQVGE